jgi:ABC-type Fe3+ transport system permease subunit
MPRLSLKWWLSIGEHCLPALARSLSLAFCAACASCVLAVISGWVVKNAARNGGAGWRNAALPRLTRIAVTLPLCSSGIVLGLGFLMLYGRGRGGGAFAELVAMHAVTALPFAASAVMEGFRSIDNGLLNAAESLGASPLKRLFTVDIPLCSRHLRSAFGFSAAVSLGELNAVMMLGNGEFETLPLLIYRAAGAYRYGTACAAGVLLIGCCAAAFYVSDVGGRARPRGA